MAASFPVRKETPPPCRPFGPTGSPGGGASAGPPFQGRDAVRVEFETQGVEIHVARLHDGPVHVHRSVTLLLPAPERPVSPLEIPPAMNRPFRVLDPLLQPREGQEGLHGGSWRGRAPGA